MSTVKKCKLNTTEILNPEMQNFIPVKLNWLTAVMCMEKALALSCYIKNYNRALIYNIAIILINQDVRLLLITCFINGSH